VDEEGFLEMLSEIAVHENPLYSLFDVYSIYYGGQWSACKTVCLVSVIDPEIDYLVSLEETCGKYHCLPEKGGLYDQSRKLMDAFQHIRIAKAQYQIAHDEKMQRDMKKK